jgi:hypothetical protein
MLNRKLRPDAWQVFFDDLSKEFQQDRVQRYVLLRVTAPELVGSRDVAPWLEFEQISYDPATRIMHVLLDGFNHRIEDPVTIWTAVKADGNVERLVVIRRDGCKDYIEFSKYSLPLQRDSLMLGRMA